MALSAIAINCSLKGSSGEPSSTDKMIGLIVSELKKRDVSFTETIRIADLNVKPGVTSDEGEGDDWPDIRRRILAADILIFGTSIWLGQMSSIAKRVTERMDAFLGETDDAGRMPSYGKVAVAAIVTTSAPTICEKKNGTRSLAMPRCATAAAHDARKAMSPMIHEAPKSTVTPTASIPCASTTNVGR